MIELTEKDRENIANMLPQYKKYAQFPDKSMTTESINKWMEV